MKYLLLISTFLISPVASANWISEDGLSDLHAGNTYKVYRTKKGCKKRETSKCYKKENKNLNYHVAKLVDVDDIEKPIYEAKSKVQSCSDKNDCFSKVSANCSGDPLVCVHYCESESVDHFIVVAKDYSEVYCTKLVGYKQKKERRLVEDATLKSDYQAKESQENTDKANKKAKRKLRKSALKNCAKASDYTNQELKDCVKALSKELMNQELKASEL